MDSDSSYIFRLPTTTTLTTFRTPGRRTTTTTSNGTASTSRRSVLEQTNTTTPRSTRTCVESLDSGCVLAIVEGRGQARGEVGMAFINMHTSNVILCQFSDTQTYQKVITKVNIFRPFEILMPLTCCENTGNPSQLYLQLKKEVSNISIVPIQRKVFSEAKGLQRIKQLVVDQYSHVVHLLTQKYYCLSAAAALLRYVELVHSVIFSLNTMKIEFQGSEKTCMIDSVTAQHLELLQNNHRPVSAHSLLGILSHCRTPGGSRLLRMNILQPPYDLKLIQLRLDCVEELMDTRDVLHGLQDVLGRLPIDIEHVISTLIQIPKLNNERLTEQRINYVIALKHTLELIPTFLTILENTQNRFFQTIREDLNSPIFNTMLEKIKSVLDEEAHVQKGSANMRRQRCFAVKAEVNPILDIARKAYIEIIADMNEYVVNLSQRHNMPFRLTQNNKRGFYVELILPGRGDQMPNFPNTFLQIRKHRNAVTFTTEFLLSIDHRIQEISKEIENISSIVISELVSNIRCDIGSLYKISEAVGDLDVLYALANYSLTTIRCVRPKFSDKATSITMGRHPVLDSVSTSISVPNNTFLSIDANFAVITGPNMSGKTTYLKQVATLQVLAQLGCFVPAESATFRIASNIFSRIGTGDNIEGGTSSFELEMTEMNYILSNVNNDSLIIIDELGRATSVEEGTAMSWAMAEVLLESKSFVLFATHYLFLTKLETMYKNALNYTMEAQEWVKVYDDEDEENDGQHFSAPEGAFGSSRLKYTHILKRGVTKIEYYGLKLASNSSYPSHIVQRASTIAKTIIENRKIDKLPEVERRKPSNQALYQLASQLLLASQVADSVSSEDLRHYLISLQKEFLATYLPPTRNQDEDEVSSGITPSQIVSSHGVQNETMQAFQNESRMEVSQNESTERSQNESRMEVSQNESTERSQNESMEEQSI